MRAVEGGFVVETLDTATDPRTNRTDDLTDALWTTVQLLSVAKRADVEGEDIALSDDVICVQGWETAAALSLTRTATTTTGDSGWFVEPFPPVERDEPWRPEELVREPAWRILQEREAAGHCLGLPVGLVAIVRADDIRAIIRESDREVLFSTQEG